MVMICASYKFVIISVVGFILKFLTYLLDCDVAKSE